MVTTSFHSSYLFLFQTMPQIIGHLTNVGDENTQKYGCDCIKRVFEIVYNQSNLCTYNTKVHNFS